MRRCLALLLLLPLSLAGAPPLPQADVTPHPGTHLPLDTPFVDAAGQPTALADLLDGRPLLLVPSYYRCPNLCSVLLDGVVQGLAATGLTAGNDYSLVALGIDHRETPGEAAAKRAELTRAYGGDGNGWHFLTGRREAVRRVTDALGYRFVYDQTLDQYAHAAAAVVVTPEGRVGRYLFGVRFEPRDLRLALVEAGEGRIGSVTDHVLLLCYGYDPESGQYNLLVMNVLRAGGIATVLGLSLMLLLLKRRKR